MWSGDMIQFFKYATVVGGRDTLPRRSLGDFGDSGGDWANIIVVRVGRTVWEIREAGHKETKEGLLLVLGSIVSPWMA